MTTIATRLADYSHYQPLITLAFVKANNLKGFAAKCTEGNYYVDAKYATNHSRARSYGLVFWAYHFMRPERSSGTAAADYFLAHASLKSGDRVLLDAEASGLGQSATNTHIKDFARRIIARSPLTGRDIYLSGGYCGNGTGKGVASYYEHIWYPRYRVSGWPGSWNPGFSVSWETNTGFNPAPHVWQCSTSPGNFDHDVSWLSVAELKGGTDIVALTAADIAKIADATSAKVWQRPLNAPAGYGYTSKQYPAYDFLRGGDAHSIVNGRAITALAKVVAAIQAKVGAPVDTKAIADAVIASLDPTAIGAAVAASVQASGVVDAQAIADAVADELGKRIES